MLLKYNIITMIIKKWANNGLLILSLFVLILPDTLTCKGSH